jgi:uncharacterized membrane protein
MEGRVKLLGHPLHQMLIVLPLGLLTGAIAFDVVRLITGNAYWSEIAYWLIAAGIIGGLLAAPFGLIDWTKVPGGTRAKRVGALHGLGNLLVVLLFAASWWLRRDDPRTPAFVALVLSFAGGALSAVTGWLGGELVDRLGVGVDDGAHLDAPSSLSGRRAHEGMRAAARH